MGLETRILLVARDVAELRERLQLSDETGHPEGELPRVGVFQAVLILRAADPVLDRQVLDRLQIERHPFDLRELRLETPDDVAGPRLPLLERLQVDLDAPAVDGRVGAVDADE